MSKTVVPIGPFHPLLEEAEYFKLTVDGEIVTDIDVDIGYMHRAHEFISERRTFTQSIFLVERICGICSTSHPLAYVHAVEDVDRTPVPARAAYIRTLVGELERIHSHLLWLGLAGHFIGYDTLWMWSWKYREAVLDMFEIISGNRNHYGMMRIGGVSRDVSADIIPRLTAVLDTIESKMNMVAKAAADDPVLRSRLKGVGVLSREAAVDYGSVGPTARASGVAIDVRRDEPKDAYGWVDFKVIVLPNGDVYDKLVVRILEIIESVKIVRQCLDKLKTEPGPILNDVKDIPAGEGIGRYEAPRGEVFHYVRSDGSNRPVRHKVRAPSYMNIPTCAASCKGIPLADALITLASIDPCYCCTERAIHVVDRRRRRRAVNLVELSRRKTDRLRRDLHG
jgi:membrane-bound hydrogenase subunit alpha